MTGELSVILSELKAGLGAIYGPRLLGLYLFGSQARGDAEEGSDIDVAMVLEDCESHSAEVRRFADVRHEGCLAHDCCVHVMPISVEDWEAARQTMVVNARREGIPFA